MYSRRRGLFVVCLVFILSLTFSSAFPVEKEWQQDIQEVENRDRPLSLIGRRRKDEIVEQESRFRRPSGADEEDDEDDDEDDDNYDDVDYDLLKRLTNEYLAKNGGNLDRELKDEDYQEIIDSYYKHLDEEKLAQGTQEVPKVSGLDVSKTTAGTKPQTTDQGEGPDRQTTTEQSSSTSWKILTTYDQKSSAITSRSTESSSDLSSTFQRTSPTTEYPDKWLTSKSSKNENSDGKTREHWWWMTTPNGGQKSLSWTGDSKGGHRVHVVVYFDK